MSDVRRDLDWNAEILMRHPEVKVEIEGHADTEGPWALNQRLGMRRARAVRSYLVECGIDRERIEVVSYGERFPAVPARSTGPASRRAEVRVLVDPRGRVDGTPDEPARRGLPDPVEAP